MSTSKDTVSSAAGPDKQEDRFVVAVYGAKGDVVSRQTFGGQEPEKAMRSFATLAATDRAQPRAAGAYVAITDTEGRLDGAQVSEGRGVTNIRFKRDEGQAMFDLASQALRAERDPSNQAGASRAPIGSIEPAVELGAPRRPTPPLEDRFNVVPVSLLRDEYRFRDQSGAVAFTERLASLTSDGTSPAAIKGMVDRAAERGWDTVTLGGSQEFRRQAWIAAEAASIKAIGYSPTQQDRDAAAKDRASTTERSDTERTRLQDAAGGRPGNKQLQQLATAVEKALMDRGVAVEIRDDVRRLMMAEATRRVASGDRFNVKLYDASAPRTAPDRSVPKQQRAHDPERAR